MKSPSNLPPGVTKKMIEDFQHNHLDEDDDLDQPWPVRRAAFFLILTCSSIWAITIFAIWEIIP